MSNTKLVSYADDNTPFAMANSELEVINEIKSVVESLTFKPWFQNNCMKVNSPSSSCKKFYQVEIFSQVLAVKNVEDKNW